MSDTFDTNDVFTGDWKNAQLRVHLTLNAYQLANVLRAIRLAPNDGDWHGEVLGQIDHELRQSGLCLDEDYDDSGDTRAQWGGTYPDKGHMQRFRRPPNTPYPDDFTMKWGRNGGKQID